MTLTCYDVYCGDVVHSYDDLETAQNMARKLSARLKKRADIRKITSEHCGEVEPPEGDTPD